MSTILNNPAANAVLAKFASTGNETCFHDRHINPQIYADLNGSNWSIKDYEARGGYQALRRILGKDGNEGLTQDQVIATVPSGKKAGFHRGRVAVRKTGSFNIQTQGAVVQGIHHRHCQIIQRADGYAYAQTPTEDSQPQKEAVRTGAR